MPTDDGYRERIRPELDARFSAEPRTVERVLDRLEEARRTEELSGLHWEDPAGIAAEYVFTLRTQQRGQPGPVKSSRCLGKLA